MPRRSGCSACCACFHELSARRTSRDVRLPTTSPKQHQPGPASEGTLDDSSSGSAT